MNKSYRIERNTVFVTKTNGEIVQIPRCEQVGKILQLENEIVQIDELIHEENEMEKYMAKRRANTFFKWAMLICVIAITIQNFILMNANFSILDIFQGLFLAIVTVSSGQALISLPAQNKSMIIYLLEDLKKRKSSKIKTLRKEQATTVMEQEERIIPITYINELRKLIKNDGEVVQEVFLQNPTVEDLTELKKLIFEYQDSLTQESIEPEKQKTIQK